MKLAHCKAGCLGCLYEFRDDCPTDVNQPPELWPCTQNQEAMIFVEGDEDDTTGKGTAPET